MKTSVKVIIAFMAIAIVGLTAGLVLSFTMKKEEVRPDIQSLEVLTTTNSPLVDISTADSEVPIYSINLNSTNKFSLEYVAKPLDMSAYAIFVKVDNEAIKVQSGSNFSGLQTGVVDFIIDYMPEDNLPVTITFEAVSNTDSSKTVISKVQILVTNPSTLQQVNVASIKYNGEKIEWQAVSGNTDFNSVDPSTIRYKIKLSYEVNGEKKFVSEDTGLGETSFALSGKEYGFELGVLNTVSIQALGDNISTADSVNSEEYKFYILKTPTYHFSDANVVVDEYDKESKAIIINKYVDGVFEKKQYLQTSENMSYGLNSMIGSDKFLEIGIFSTVARNSMSYDENAYNSVKVDGVEYFDSPKLDNVIVATLDKVNLSLDNFDNSVDSLSGNKYYAPTRITWDKSFDDIRVNAIVNYLVTITNGQTQKEYITTNTYFDIDSSVLADIRTTSGYGKYSITIKAFAPMSDFDNGEKENDAIDNILIIDSLVSNKVEVEDYWKFDTDLKINRVGTILEYSMPTRMVGRKYVDELTFEFTSSKGDKVTFVRTSSGSIDLSEVLLKSGTYNLKVYAKATDGVLNSLYEFEKLDVYKTIGAVNDLSIDKDGNLEFTDVAECKAYDILITIGNDNYSTQINKGEDFNIVEFLESRNVYEDIEGNYEDEAYILQITTIPSNSLYNGSTTYAEFKKLGTIGQISESNLNKIDLVEGKIVWGSVAGATEYEVSVVKDGNILCSVVISRGETSLAVNGSLLKEYLVNGDNTISVQALGVENEESVYLKGNIETEEIAKLYSANSIYIKNDKLYFDASNVGSYLIELREGDTLKDTKTYTNEDSSNLNVISLSEFAIEENITYVIYIKKTLEGYFDADYSDPIFVTKIPARKMTVISNAGKNYIVWQALEDENIKNDVVYSSNADNELTASSVGDLVGVCIDNIRLGDSDKLVDEKLYVFELGLSTNKVFDTTTSDSPAYISSSVSSVRIVRLQNPQIETTNTNINLVESSIKGIKAYDLKIKKQGEDSYLFTNGSITPSGFSTSFDTTTYIVSYGKYDIEVKAYGNIDSIASFDKSVDFEYTLNSSVSTKTVTKLNPVELSIIEYNKRNCLEFTNTNQSNDVEIKYSVYKTSLVDGSKVKLTSLSYDLIEENDKYILNIKETGNNLYSVVVETLTNGYLSSVESNLITIYNMAMNTSEIIFVAEDKISFEDFIDNGKVVSSKYYIDITTGADIVAKYIISINGEERTVACVFDSTFTTELSEIYNYGINYKDNKYTIDIAYLKNQNIVLVNNSYVITIYTLGLSDNVEGFLYNDKNSGLSSSFTYFDKFDMSSIRVDNNLIIPTSLIPNGYNVVILTIEDEDDIREVYEFTLDNNNVNITSDKGNTLKLSRNSSRDILLDFADYEYGTYTINLAFNKNGRLGVITKTSDNVVIEKIANPFDSTTSNEKIIIENGEIFIEGAKEGRTYYLYQKVSGSSILLGAYEKDSFDDLIKVEYSDWNFDEELRDIYVSLVVGEEGKLISDDMESLYHFTKLSSSNITLALEYENNYDLANYVVSFRASNFDLNKDLASGYVLKLMNGSTVIDTYTIEANKSIEADNYSVTYLDGNYTLKIKHNAYQSIDKTKQTTIKLCKVIGLEEKTNVVVGQNYYINNEAENQKVVTYLNVSQNIEIKSGIIQISGYNANCTAYLSITNGSDKVFERDLSISEVLSGLNIDLTNNASVPAGTYDIELRYIGNNDSVVTSEAITLLSVVKTATPTLAIENGSIYILNAVDGAKYNYKVKVGDTLFATKEVVGNGKLLIENANIPTGNSNILINVINTNELKSDDTNFALYKYFAISNLQKSIVTLGATSQRNDLQLKFTANNIVGGVDRVYGYRIIFTSKLNNETYEIEKLVSNVTSDEFVNNEYIFQITNLAQIIDKLGTEFSVAIVSFADNQNIENLSISSSNTVDVVKITAPKKGAIQIVDGSLSISKYEYPLDDPSYTVDKVTVRFVDSKGVEYIYENSNFDKYDTLMVDLTITQVNKNGSWLYLPSEKYSLYLSYKSTNVDIIAGDEACYENIVKTASVENVTVEDYDLYLESTLGEGVVYNYIITKPGSSIEESVENYISNTINHQDNSVYIFGQYKIKIQKIVEGELKSDYSQELIYHKVSPSTLSAQVVKTAIEYYIEVAIKAPSNNFYEDNGKLKDNTYTYGLRIADKNYEIVSDTITTDGVDILDRYGNINSKVRVSFDLATKTYKVKIDIATYELFENSNGEYVIAENNAGKVVVTGVNETEKTIEIELTKQVGRFANKTINYNTTGLDDSKATITKLQNGDITLEIRDGIVVVNGLESVTNASKKELYFYKELSTNVYDVVDPYIWDLDDNSTNINLHDIIPAGKYLVAIRLLGDYELNIIDSSIKYLRNDDSEQVMRVVDTPKLYIDNGVLMWTSVQLADEDVYYELTLSTPSGETIKERLTNELSYDSSGLDFEAGSYEASVFAIVDGAIKSNASEIFNANKLVSPQVSIVRENRVLKLKWNAIENATGYEIYDYSVTAKEYKMIDAIEAVAGQEDYEWELRTDIELGEHKFYIISSGSKLTILEGDVFETSGYLSSSNSYDNAIDGYVSTITAIINTTDQMWMQEGVLYWNKVDNVDYYDVLIKAYFIADDNEVTTIEYLVSTKETILNISAISHQNINLADYYEIAISTKSNNNSYLVVTDSVEIPRPYTNIVVFGSIVEKMMENISISSGMLRYTISKQTIENFETKINTYKLADTEEVDLDLSKLFISENNLLIGLVTPILTINSKEYRLGEDITNHIAIVYSGLSAEQFNYEEISNAEPLDGGVYRIDIYIPLPGSLPYGKYKINFQIVGNTTETKEDVSLSTSLKSSNIEGYKLDSPKNIFLDTQAGNGYEMYNGVLKFRPAYTMNMSNSIYISSYQLYMSSTENGGDTRQVTVNITHDKSKLYTASYGGYIDITKSLVEIDIYRLFGLCDTDLNNENRLYGDFAPLNAGVNYTIRIAALGSSVTNADPSNSEVKYTNYFNSNFSSLKKTFTILQAPSPYISGGNVNWVTSTNVEKYDIYFYNLDEELIFTEELSELPDKGSIFEYTNIRNNVNLEAGVYKINIVAIGNGVEHLTSRQVDSPEFVIEKLAPVEVEVKNGLYEWNNSKLTTIIRNGNDITNIDVNYPFYNVEIYQNQEYKETLTIFGNVNESKTVFELPEEYMSLDGSNNPYIYTIKVYTSVNIDNEEHKLTISGTSITKNTWLISSDDNIGFDIEVGRERSSQISGGFRILKDGDIYWTDKYNMINNYIVFIYSQSGNLVFESVRQTSPQLNIYTMLNENGETFTFENEGEYTIKIKSIDKVQSTDLGDELGILRSVYEGDFTVFLIKKPRFRIDEGDISWDTKFTELGQEFAPTRMIVSGKFLVGTQVKTTSLWLEFSTKEVSFDFVYGCKAEPVYINSILDHYKLTTDNKSTTAQNIRYMEGENYKISVRFIGFEYQDIVLGQDNTYLISSEEFVRNVVMLENPKAPINPKLLEISNNEADKTIFDNIPIETNYKNYLFWSFTNVNGEVCQDYDVEIYLRNLDQDKPLQYSMLYELKIKNLLGAYSDKQILLYDKIANTNPIELKDTNYLTVVNNVGIYFALDKILKDIAESPNNYDFMLNDICVYVEAVGSTVGHEVVDLNEKYHITNHYDIEDKLLRGTENEYVLSITLPSTPQNLTYDSFGKISWKERLGEDIYHELVVVYSVDGITENDAHYSNISRQSIVIDVNGDLVDEGNGITINSILELLGITENEYNIIFGSKDSATKYFIDTIIIPEGQYEYKLRYLTNSIKIITLRAISVMKSEGDDEFMDKFISLPATIKAIGNVSMAFNLYDGGDGTENYPFKIKPSKIINIEYYMEDYCYFKLDVDANNNETSELSGTNSTIFLKNKKTFNGVLDGQGATLNIQYVNYKGYQANGQQDSSDIATLFYRIGQDSIVMNLNINVINPTPTGQDFYINVQNDLYVASIAYENYGTIANVKVRGEMYVATSAGTDDDSPGKAFVGGLVNYNYGNIYYCDISLNMTANTYMQSYIGGIVTYNGSNDEETEVGVISTSSYGGIMKGHYLGGICNAIMSGKIEYCANVGKFIYNNDRTDNTENSAHYIGGIVMRVENGISGSRNNKVSIRNSYADISGIEVHISRKYKVIIGGVVAFGGSGTNTVDISNCYANFNNGYSITNTANATIIKGGIYGVGIGGATYNNVRYNTYSGQFDTYDGSNKELGNQIKPYNNTEQLSGVYYSTIGDIRINLELIDGYRFDNNSNPKLVVRKEIIS